ncbi:hypothetical protein [Mycobacterium intracellulare]|uniref:hypothetical protein n=1 Tax=Mycobacterium intracellulare TaxID=1767 RepID=UPI001CD951EC|nr:hypothetical protein [Mycobacterium intracellulare]
MEAPGYWVVRAEAERRLRGRGWCAATSPADADVLAVCGSPGPELTKAIERVWDQLPGPRVRIELPDPEAVESALDRAAVQLVDIDMQRNDARQRAQSPDLSGEQDHTDHGGHHRMNHGDMEHAAHDAMDHSRHHHMNDDDMDHGAHGHMHHGDMDMAPAGIALAEGGDDRDGLEMDVLHVHLGPVLRYWPAGLVVRGTMHGDVLAGVEAWVTDSDSGNGNPRPQGQNDAAARHCDHIVDLLALAGSPRAAAIARTARDALLSEPDLDHAGCVLAKLHGSLRHSRVLRWSLRDIASLTTQDCDSLGLPTDLAGDCYDRLLTRVDMVGQALSNQLKPNEFHVTSTTIVDALPHLVSGLDLATARLVIATLGIDTASGHTGGHHG